MKTFRFFTLTILFGAAVAQLWMVRKTEQARKSYEDAAARLEAQLPKAQVHGELVVTPKANPFDCRPKCKPGDPLYCAVIHEPIGGCPKGYLQESSPRFHEKDGSVQFACVSGDPKKRQCTDELRPGETMSIDITPLILDYDQPKGPRT